MVVTDKQTWRWKTRCSTEVAQRKINRPINSGKRVESIDRVDRSSAESSRSTGSTKVESIDRVGRFSVELSRFVRLGRFQGLITESAISNVLQHCLDCVINYLQSDHHMKYTGYLYFTNIFQIQNSYQLCSSKTSLESRSYSQLNIKYTAWQN